MATNDTKKTVGIIGGMGPGATVELFRLMVLHTKSETDSGHMHILIDNYPQIPDRTQAILGGGASPLPCLLSSAERLKRAGADFLVIPCNTSHHFLPELRAGADIEIVSMIDETAKHILQKGYRRIGLLATDGTLQSRIYHKQLAQYGMELLTPDEAAQRDVMDFIYRGVKAGSRHFDAAPFQRAADALFAQGAETLILGCTELPVGMKLYGLDFPSVDTLDILARAAVVKAGYPLAEGND